MLLHPLLFTPAYRTGLMRLLVAGALGLTSCSSNLREAEVQETSLAYLGAFQRIAQDLAPQRMPDALAISQKDGKWLVIAREVPLDHIVQSLDPSIPLSTLPVRWIGQPVSLSLQAETRLDCLRQLAESRDVQLVDTESGPRLQAAVPASPAPGARVDRVITLRHAPTSALSEQLQPFLSEGNLDVRIAFSPETNQVMLLGEQGVVESLSSIIAALDRSPSLCRVQAWIATRAEINELRFEPQPLLRQGGWEVNLAAPPDVENVFEFVNGEIGVSLLSGSQNPGQENLRVNAFVSRTQQASVSAPSLLCLSGQSASLQIGRTGWRLFTTPTSPTSSYITPQNITTGVTLKITPKVIDLQTIELAIEITTSKFSPSDQLVANLKERKAASVVRVRKGDVIRLSGLSLATTSETQQGLSWLRTLPAVQWLFQSEKKSAQDNSFDAYLTVDIAEAGDAPLDPTTLQRIGSALQRPWEKES